MAKKVLVTGGGGYIGSVATYQFLKEDFEVVVFDNFSTGYRKPLELLREKFGKDKLRLYQVDLHDELTPYLKKETGISAVAHFAGSLSVDESMKDPGKYFYNNVSGSINLLRELIKNDIKNIIFSSSCVVYGQAKYLPIDEDHPKEPNNTYGLSKKMVEDILLWYEKLLGVSYVIFRYFNVCGASGDGLLGYSNRPSLHLINNAVKGALKLAPFYLTCSEVETPDKTPIRDYVDIVDLAKAHVKGVNYLLAKGQSQIINLGTGKGNSVLEIIKKVEEVTGSKLNVGKTTPRKGEAAKMVASIAKAQKVLDWYPERTLEDSIKSAVFWYQKHPEGWEN